MEIPDEDAQEETAVRPTKATGLRSVLADDFDVWQAVGGVRGLIETTAPGVVFLVAYVATREILPSVAAPLVASLLLVLIRVLQRIDVTPALGGVLGVVISAVWAGRSGEASNYFAVGLITNAAYLVGLLASLALRWPAMGLIVGFMRGDATGWRSDPAQAITRRRYVQMTWLWSALFGLRLAIQVPLFAADATAALAVAKLVMGPGLFALVAWFTWMMVRGLPPVAAGGSDN